MSSHHAKNTNLVAIPEGTTSYSQLYIPVNMPFNYHLKQLRFNGSWLGTMFWYWDNNETHGNGSLQKWQSEDLKCAELWTCRLTEYWWMNEYLKKWEGGSGIVNVGNINKNVSTECEKEDWKSRLIMGMIIRLRLGSSLKASYFKKETNSVYIINNMFIIFTSLHMSVGGVWN